MTRKDYVMIAEAIQGAVNYEQNFNNNEAGADALKKFSVMLSALLMADNPRFDANRFFDACEVK
jgi:hypothetical protein